jgi:hypothetical protein
MLFEYQVNHYQYFQNEQQLSIVIIVIIVYIYNCYFICVTNKTDYLFKLSID